MTLPPRWGSVGNSGTGQWRRGSLVPLGTPGTTATATACAAVPKVAWLCRMHAAWHGMARHGMAAKVQALLLQQQILAGSSLVSCRSLGVASTGVFRTD